MNNKEVKPMDAIFILNEKYADKNIHKGYVGVVVENLIEEHGYILADFDNPFTGEYIYVQAEIEYNDFKILTSSTEDKRIVKAYKDLFRR